MVHMIFDSRLSSNLFIGTVAVYLCFQHCVICIYMLCMHVCACSVQVFMHVHNDIHLHIKQTFINSIHDTYSDNLIATEVRL